MKTLYVLFFGFVFLCGCTQKKEPLMGDSKFQQELNAEYKDASTSPLKKKDRKNFKGLEFFKIDSAYVVNAILKRTPDTEYFDMQTTTSRISRERVFGLLNFTLEGKSYQLSVYQGEELMQEEGFEDYLFLPFLDDTNGDGSYGGGRYIDLRIPEGDEIIVDFNAAYNPYCAYDEKYSCPIVPRGNYIDVEVKAGVKAFNK